MTRIQYPDLIDASYMFPIRGVRISPSDTIKTIGVATVSSKPAQRQDAPRMPMVEHRLGHWPIPQPFVHDCDVFLNGARFRVFFQRHKRLPMNENLAIRGDLIIMRVGKRNVYNVVNLRKGDIRRARLLAKRFAPHLARFQDNRRRKLNRLMFL